MSAQCILGYTPWTNTPWADTPQADTPRQTTPLSRHPLCRHPSRQPLPSEALPLEAHLPWKHIPPMATAADDRHPTGMLYCWMHGYVPLLSLGIKHVSTIPLLQDAHRKIRYI